MKMNKNIWFVIAALVLLVLFIKPAGKLSVGQKMAGETLSRSLSASYVHPSETFTVTYNVGGQSAAPFFFSIKDILTGGCLVSGSSSIITTLTSPASATGAITVTAPATTGNCYFDGNYQLGSNAQVTFSPQGNVRICNAVNCVQSTWSPATTTVCPGYAYTQTRTTTTAADCGGTACGALSQGATGAKSCGTTPSITTSDTFANGCTGGTAGTCLPCYTYGDGFGGSCVKDINTCNNGVGRTELGCVAQEWINAGGTDTLRRYLGDSAQDWINKGGPA